MNEWNDAERRVEKAHELYERGRWQEALDELKAAIAINPYNGSWHFNLGLTYDALDKFDAAIAAYRQALEIDPDDLEILCALGVDSNRTGCFDEAIGFFEKIESLDPAYEACYCNRIVSYAEKADHEKAEEMFFLARQYREHCPVCYYHMGSSLFARGLFDRALWCWQQVQSTDPDYPQVHARIADALWAKGQLPEARTHFIEELRASPGNLDIMLDLGELLMEMQEWTPAAEKFRQVLELSPEDGAALFHLGELALRENATDDALDFFKRALKSDRTFPGAHLRIAQLYLQRHHPAEAAFHANCELSQHDSDEQTLVELGNLFLDIEQPSMAETALRRVLLVNPQNAAARHNLAVALLKAGRTSEGIDEERKALKVQPKYMLAMHNLALAYLSLKDLTRARFWLNEALDIAPADAQLRQLKRKIRLTGAASWLRRLPRGLGKK